MDFSISHATSDHAVDGDYIDVWSRSAMLETGQSEPETLHILDRRRKLLEAFETGMYRPFQKGTMCPGKPEHIIREERARQIVRDYATGPLGSASTPSSPNRNATIMWPRDLPGKDSRCEASVIGLLSPSPGAHSPSPSLESGEIESLEIVEDEDEDQIDQSQARDFLCVLCRQINVEVLAGGLLHHLLPDLYKSGISCNVCDILLKIIGLPLLYARDNRHLRVKIALDGVRVWNEKTGKQIQHFRKSVFSI